MSPDELDHLLQSGAVDRIAALAGDAHGVGGVVEHGDHRGRLLGFPTANVSIAGDQRLPCDGVFAGWAHTATAGAHPTAISLGRRPTFYQERGHRLLEAHLIDFDGDLYDQLLRVEFVRFLRPQHKFDGVDDLTAQLRRDVAEARADLTAAPPPVRPTT